MKPRKNNIDSFQTELGKVDFILIISTDADVTKLGDRIIIKTLSYFIEIIAFDNLKEWVREDFSVETSMGWIIRVIKINDLKEDISIQCLLNPKDENISSDIDSGEHLNALWIENDTYVVSIGTEDGEVMKYRAKVNDWMPSRFQNVLGYQGNSELSFTNYLDFGLNTTLPELRNGEKIYFHYLVATNKRKKSKYHPNEDDISTNYAVDFFKETIIEKLKIKELQLFNPNTTK